jgi:hypothetical protein
MYQIAGLDVHVTLQNIDDMHLMAALNPGFHQAAGRVQTAIARQYGNFHKMTEVNKLGSCIKDCYAGRKH